MSKLAVPNTYCHRTSGTRRRRWHVRASMAAQHTGVQWFWLFFLRNQWFWLEGERSPLFTLPGTWTAAKSSKHNHAFYKQPVRSAYQPPASSILSEQTSHQQSANNTFLSEQISTSQTNTLKLYLTVLFFQRKVVLFWFCEVIHKNIGHKRGKKVASPNIIMSDSPFWF
jgi:hypothetical protein